VLTIGDKFPAYGLNAYVDLDADKACTLGAAALLAGE
jgi:hypothetical protein